MCYLCRSYPCDPRCPNYEPPKASLYCSICDEGIYEDERYIQNDDDECAHIDCLAQMSIHELAEWFGFDIKTMIE